MCAGSTCVQTPHVAVLQASGRAFVHSGMGGVASYRLRLNGQAELSLNTRLKSNEAMLAWPLHIDAGSVSLLALARFFLGIVMCEAVREGFQLCLTITPAGLADLQAVCPAPSRTTQGRERERVLTSVASV